MPLTQPVEVCWIGRLHFYGFKLTPYSLYWSLLSRIQKDLKYEPRSVNSAGTINRNNKLWEVPAEEFDSVIDTNIKGTANVLRHFIPLMLEKKQGVILNMSSLWGRSAAAQVKLSFYWNYQNFIHKFS